MSASKEVKSKGLPSLKFVYTKANVKPRTFNYWYYNNRKLFDIVVAGVKAMTYRPYDEVMAEANLTFKDLPFKRLIEIKDCCDSGISAKQFKKLLEK